MKTGGTMPVLKACRISPGSKAVHCVQWTYTCLCAELLSCTSCLSRTHTVIYPLGEMVTGDIAPPPADYPLENITWT